MAGKFADRSRVGWTQIKPGADRITVHGEKCSAVLNRIVFGFPDYYHKHMNEQISYIVSGSCDFTVGDQTYHAKQGDFVVIPSDTIHNATVTDPGGCTMLDIFAPVREEFPESNLGAKADGDADV
jgi:quercetin dioxygenase-like cupin family protein